MTFQAATGHDNEAGYTTIYPEPVSDGVKYYIYTTTPTGLVLPNGTPYILWEFNNLKVEWYEAILTAIGFSTTDPTDTWKLCTIDSIGYDRATFSDFNARCIHVKGRDAQFSLGVYRSASFLFRELEAT